MTGKSARRFGMHGLAFQGAVALRDQIAAGAWRATEVTEACLARIEASEPEVKAWRFLGRDLALKQAADADALRNSGRPIGPLHGVPVGIKDILYTADMPTENGTV